MSSAAVTTGSVNCAIDAVDQHPRPLIGHPHVACGCRDRAGVADAFEQLTLPGPIRAPDSNTMLTLTRAMPHCTTRGSRFRGVRCAAGQAILLGVLIGRVTAQHKM